MNGQQISIPVGISNAFNGHFTNIQQTNISVPDCIDSNEQDARLVNFIKSHISEATVFHIPPITTQQVIEDLKNIPNNKATRLDGIGIKPSKFALNAIAPSLTHIYNSSIASGIFPNNFKRAKLTPVYEKDSVHDRYNRPFVRSGHVVRNKLHWDANYAVGLPKQRNSHQSSPTFLCFESPTE